MKTKPKIQICIGSSCFARGNERNVEVTENFLNEHHLSDEADVELSGSLCTGRCSEGPIVIVNGTVHTHVTGGVMLDILKSLFAPPQGDDK